MKLTQETGDHSVAYMAQTMINITKSTSFEQLKECIDYIFQSADLYHKHNMQLLSPENAEDQFQSYDTTPSYNSCDEAEFVSLINRYSPDQSESIRSQLLESITSSAWFTIVFNPFLAEKLIQICRHLHPSISRLLLPLCQFGYMQNPDPTMFANLISSATSDDYRFRNGISISHMNLVATAIRTSVYEYPNLLEERVVQTAILHLASICNSFWNLFFTDLYVRHKCNYIHLPNDLVNSSRTIYDIYCHANPHNSLVKVLPFLLATHDTAENLSRTEMFKYFENVAKACSTIVDANWVMKAFLRTIRLYEGQGEPLAEVIVKIIQKINTSISSRSTFIQFIRLHGLLTAFVQTRSVKYIIEYERRFLNCRKVLFPTSISHLQLEYASSLYLGLQELGMEATAGTHFMGLVASNSSHFKSPLLYNHPLSMVNPAIGKGLLDAKHVGSILQWLLMYTTRMFRMYADRLVRGNHLTAYNYRICKHIYSVRSQLSNAIMFSLMTFIERTDVKEMNDLCLRSAGTFKFLPRNQEPMFTLMLRYISIGLQGDLYEILRNATDIAESLYACYFYGHGEIKTTAAELFNTLASLTGIGTGEANVSWAYYAGLKCEVTSIETEFISSLWREIKKSKPLLEVRINNADRQCVVFPTAVIELISESAVKGSLFAGALRNDLTSSEIWNIIGTTLYNCRMDDDPGLLEQVSTYYSFAICFSSEKMIRDQKYMYNYIRLRSMCYQITGVCPPEHFVGDVSRYLNTNRAEYFTFKRDNTVVFFDIISKWWNNMSHENKEYIVGILARKRKWIREELNNREIVNI